MRDGKNTMSINNMNSTMNNQNPTISSIIQRPFTILFKGRQLSFSTRLSHVHWRPVDFVNSRPSTRL